MPNIRDIYTARVYYRGHSGNNKPRPVLIINTLQNDMFTIAEITSVSPKDPPSYFDRFKEPILKWQQCGLDQESWVKCFKGNIHNVDGSRLHQHIGSMDVEDFNNAVMNIFTKNNNYRPL